MKNTTELVSINPITKFKLIERVIRAALSYSSGIFYVLK